MCEARAAICVAPSYLASLVLFVLNGLRRLLSGDTATALKRLSSNKFLEELTEKLQEAGEIWTKEEVIQQFWSPNCLCFVFVCPRLALSMFMRDGDIPLSVSRGDSGVRTAIR